MMYAYYNGDNISVNFSGFKAYNMPYLLKVEVAEWKCHILLAPDQTLMWFTLFCNKEPGADVFSLFSKSFAAASVAIMLVLRSRASFVMLP